jgi:sugar lactone lactonase YvrE
MQRSSIVACLTILAALSSLPARSAEVTTLAGSGLPGLEDGPAKTASFLMPEGLALAPSGDLYVADAAGQRVRRVSSSGIVSTVAGSGGIDASGLWVPGGFADGPAQSARFNQPSAVAVTPSGAIVVADTANHCLRFIRGGIVSTYAGRCGEAGSQDGTLTAARFAQPRALAFDTHGILYVGDTSVGVRRVAPDGSVTTLTAAPPDDKSLRDVTGLSVCDACTSPQLFVAARGGMLVYDLTRSAVTRFYKTGVWDDDPSGAYVAGTRTFGYPFAIAAVDDDKVVYTDIATNSIRFFTGSGENVAAGPATENAGFSAGEFRDGGSDVARVDQPMGLVRTASGAFVFSDTGNRRIRTVSGIDFRYQVAPSELAADTKYYRIFFLGNSDTSSNQQWDQSISGIVEQGLSRNWRALGLPKPPRVYPRQVLADMNGTRDFIDQYLATGLADMVILQLNTGHVSMTINRPITESVDPYAAQWQPQVTDALRTISTTLSKNRVPFLVALDPLPWEVSPSESAYTGIFLPPGYSPAPGPPTEYERSGELLREAAAAAGVPVVNAFPIFAREELLPTHPALFGARDSHLSVQGAAVYAQTILNELLKTKPWREP